MLSIAKPIKIKELLHQFLLLMLNLHYIFLFTVFLPDRGIAALPHFFGKCRTIISPRGPKGAKKENKKRVRRCGSFLFSMLFTLCESFAWQTLASLGLISIILFRRRSNKNTLGARDFSSAVSGFCQVCIVTRRPTHLRPRCVGLRPTPKIPAAREKNL